MSYPQTIRRPNFPQPDYNINTASPFPEFPGYNRPYNFSVDLVDISGTFTYPSGTTAFLFVNTGAVIVRINNKILYPGTVGTNIGDAYAVGAHKDDLFKGQIQIIFDAGAGPQCEVTTIFYMDVKQR